MSPPPRDELEEAAALLGFARERLGPASAELLRDPAIQARALARRRNGDDVEDAVLGEVHGAMSGSPELADEFLAYFLRDLLRLGHRLKPLALRRFLDTGDLVQSVLGDLWREIASVRYETRGRYLAYLARKLRWKASKHDRARRTLKRSEGPRSEVPLDELGGSEPTPEERAARSEEADRLALALMRMGERDRRLLSRHLKGATLAEIAEEEGLTYDAARMALGRAMRRARRLL